MDGCRWVPRPIASSRHADALWGKQRFLPLIGFPVVPVAASAFTADLSAGPNPSGGDDTVNHGHDTPSSIPALPTTRLSHDVKATSSSVFLCCGLRAVATRIQA